MSGYRPLVPRHLRAHALALVAIAGLWLTVLGAIVSRRAEVVTVVAPPAGAAAAGPLVGAAAPDFELPLLDGGTVRLSELRGQAVLVNFWATWCGPCRLEMPTIQSFYEQQRSRGFTVLAINRGERPAEIAGFMRETALSLPVALDRDGAVAARYQAQNIPASYFIDRDGIVRARYLGPMSRSVLQASLEALLR